MFNCNFPAQVDWIKNKILTSPNSSPKTINEKGMGIGLGWYNDPGCHLPTAHSTYNSNCSLLKLIWTSSIKFQALVYNQLNNLAVNSHWSLTELLKENVHSAERVKKWLLATARHESRVRYCRSAPAAPAGWHTPVVACAGSVTSLSWHASQQWVSPGDIFPRCGLNSGLITTNTPAPGHCWSSESD